jgi:hypothetical protein
MSQVANVDELEQCAADAVVGHRPQPGNQVAKSDAEQYPAWCRQRDAQCGLAVQAATGLHRQRRAEEKKRRRIIE